MELLDKTSMQVLLKDANWWDIVAFKEKNTKK